MRKEAQILTAYVRLLCHQSARTSHTHPPWVLQGYPSGRSYSLLYFQKKWELDYPGSAMSGDERDAMDGCARSWKPVSIYVSPTSSQDMYPFTICGQGPPLEEEGTLSLSPQNVEKRDMWIPIFHAADEDLQWWMLGHNVLMGARVIPKDPDA